MPATLTLLGAQSEPAEGASAAHMDFRVLSDVSGSMSPEYGRTSFNEQSDVLYAALAVRNAGQYSVEDQRLRAAKIDEVLGHYHLTRHAVSWGRTREEP